MTERRTPKQRAAHMAELLADVTAHAVRQVTGSADGAGLGGLYHLSASGQTSWHGYASFVLETALKLGATLKASQIGRAHV